MKKFYIKCKPPKEQLLIKVTAENEKQAIEQLKKDTNVTQVVSVNGRRVNRKEEPKTYDSLARNQYPYIKNSNSKAVRIFT